MSKEKFQQKPAQEFTIVRIMQTDIPGNKRTLAGLTYIKGVSWSISNAMCKLLQLDPMKKIGDLSEVEIKRIFQFLENPQLPLFLMNRRKDIETGSDFHLITTKLDMTKEFDIRRLKKIRSYRGLRHATGQPTRGQRTRSHFRTRGKKAAGMKKSPEVAAKGAKKP
ncbi:30S ribosomal protein S13 [Candidatus Pacearchaeota archaeon]|nr:30S ribosomal protein S13 [Candidatus Pacearchaeota archaeon]